MQYQIAWSFHHLEWMWRVCPIQLRMAFSTHFDPIGQGVHHPLVNFINIFWAADFRLPKSTNTNCRQCSQSLLRRPLVVLHTSLSGAPISIQIHLLCASRSTKIFLAVCAPEKFGNHSCKGSSIINVTFLKWVRGSRILWEQYKG